jgi:hypothetical protein
MVAALVDVRDVPGTKAGIAAAGPRDAHTA